MILLKNGIQEIKFVRYDFNHTKKTHIVPFYVITQTNDKILTFVSIVGLAILIS